MDITKYLEIRKEMKTADLLQWRTRGVAGTLIRWKTRSNVNHSSLVLRLSEYEQLERRRYTTEALGHGTVLSLLSRRLEQFNGEVWWYPLVDEWNDKRQGVGERSLSLIGVPYDYRSIFKQIIGHVSTNAQKLFCSEYCFIAYGFGGVAPTPAEMPKLNIFKPAVKL